MPLMLKEVMIRCDISMAILAKGIRKPGGNGSYSKAMIFKVLETGTTPMRESAESFQLKVEKYLLEFHEQEYQKCLQEMGIKFEDLWVMVTLSSEPLNSGIALDIKPEDIGKEAELLNEKAKLLFGLEKDPFVLDIRSQSDMFMGVETKYMFYAMKSAAINQGLMAMSGNVGAGKTTAIKWLISELKKDESIYVVRPRSLDKSKISEKALADAIMQDVAGHNSAPGPERRARQLEKMLIKMYRDGNKVALLIDEAHLLTPKAVLLLKALYEIEDGFDKTIGIVLIGQMELRNQLLNIILHPELEPFVARCNSTEITGLGDSLPKYLAHKFQKAKMNVHKVFTPGAIEALGERLTVRRDKTARSIAFPLIVNNVAVKAMNAAAKMGEEKVTVDVVNGLSL